MRSCMSVALLLAVVGCNDSRSDRQERLSRSEAQPPNVVAESIVGPLRIGMSPEAVRGLVPVVRDSIETNATGTDSERVLTVVIAGDPVRVFVGSGVVGEIEVASPSLRTRDGIGVGSPFRRLAGYPAPHAEVVHGYMGMRKAGLCGVYFLAPSSGLETGDDLDSLVIARLDSTVRIARILVGPCYS